MKKGVVGAVVLLGAAMVTAWIARRQVPVTWRLVPVQQSVILPPALGTVTLSPGGRLVQSFTPPARSSGLLTLDLVRYTGSTPPSVHVLLRNAAGSKLFSGSIPPLYLAAHTVSIPFVDPQVRRSGRYTLALDIRATRGSGGGQVSIAASDLRPSGSALLVSGRSYPATLGITILYQVPVGAYLLHYSSLLLGGRSIGSSISIAVFHLLWLLSMLAVIGVAAAFVLRTIDGSEGVRPEQAGRGGSRRRHAGRSVRRPKPGRRPVASKGRRA